MCGIFGYVGSGNASEKIINGLHRLEYRGYDSWGVAVVKENKIDVVKKVGPIGSLDDLKSLPESHIGIGHTRWATHGGVTQKNAHPHYSTDKGFVLAQNGIVENYQELRKELLEDGYKFESETDTEVIVRLVEKELLTTKNLRKAVREAFLRLEGRNTIILLSSFEEHVIAVRNGSPLVIGIGDGEYFFASDTLSFADTTNKVIYMNDNEMVEYTQGDLRVFDVIQDKELAYDITELDYEETNIDKEGYDHFMLKEIVEQKFTVREAVQYTLEELQPLIDAIKKSKIVYTVGAGTASYEAGQIAYLLRLVSGVKAIELKSYEMSSYKELFTKDDLILAFSQSGETADTIEALEFAKAKGTKIASVVNMIGSTITRMSDFSFFARSGPEICVCSTKAFTAKLAWGTLLAYSLVDRYEEARKDIIELSGKLANFLNEDTFSKVKSTVEVLKNHQHIFILGRGQNYYITLEGALKIKEISYVHAEGFGSGELKHGVIALIDKGTPVISIISDDSDKENILSSVAQVKARGAFTIGIGTEENELFDNFIEVPKSKIAGFIANIIPFQLISYFLSQEYGLNPDKPRNLAKSVTVK